MKEIISKLDLNEFIDTYEHFLARPKPLFMEGDVNLHFRFIKKISPTDFTPPKEVENLDSSLMYLKKSGTLKLREIYTFVKIIEYFLYLKKLKFEDEIQLWLEKIIIPPEVLEIVRYFDEKGRLRDEIDERFVALNQGIKHSKEQIKEQLRRLLTSSKLSPYLVDRQIHYLDESETLLVRGGFNHVLKGSVAGRSTGGFFYVIPEALSTLKKKEAEYLSQKLEVIYEYEKKISSVFTKFEPFLSFINKEFDRFDNYQARILFAKSRELEFIKPQKNSIIKLENFSHPALHDAKPISINFEKKILMITGVNAGGKTMLLKAILSSVFMAKYLLPMPIDANHSSIGHFKEINAIIDDPQSVKNDISTFAGRMQEFSKLFGKDNFIVGVDEIELGTDSDEAATLFKVILEKLIEKNSKIIITTHHKRLAAMMAVNDEVDLLAAIYDEKNQKPTYEFLHGTIGKSYAFETAQRYGIPALLIAEAKVVHGEDKEKLGELIQKNIDLELEAKRRLVKLKDDDERVQKLKTSLEFQKEKADESLRQTRASLEKKYQEAIETAKSAAKEQDPAQIHRLLNQANKQRNESREQEMQQEPLELKIGDYVKYNNAKGVIISMRKKEATIESEGMKLRVPISQLKRSGNKPPPKKKPQVKIKVQKPSFSSVKLDLHGLRSEEAIEKLDKYLSDALITGYDEVLIYHGVGSGKLAYAVKTFLKSHPKIKGFIDAPANMGGMGATVVRL
ncbi:MAG TPA: endonuclease MutS2 [Campylobacterales bacterium]|nr:endonuclease MutS2 [Campylobacterales bacterium]